MKQERTMRLSILLFALLVWPVAATAADFADLLHEAQTGPIPPMRVLPFDRDLFVDELAIAGRLDELGITRAQAGVLYDELAKRMPVTVAPPRRPPPELAPPTGTARYRSEFDPLVGVLMRWPIGEAPFLPTYYGMIDALADSLDMLIIVANDNQENTVRTQLGQQGIPTDRIDFAHWPTDTIWTRDYGPIFIGEGDAAPYGEGVVNMKYSRSWRTNDDRIPVHVADLFDDPLYDAAIVQDGGNLLTDGRGTCFSTVQTRDNNPGWTDEQIEAFYRDFLGCEQLILTPKLLNEGTGHIDMGVKVVGPHTVMVGEYPAGDPNYQTLEDTAALIAGSTALDGEPYEVVRIAQRSSWTLGVLAVFHTYTNGLLTNDYVLVPEYSLAADEAALAVYADLFPEREAVLVNSQNIIYSGGALHCITMERQDYSQDIDDDDDTDDDDDDNNDNDNNDNDDATDDDDDDDNDNDDDDDSGCGC
jgi:agmatine deiminase